jgi:hypothetical protein
LKLGVLVLLVEKVAQYSEVTGIGELYITEVLGAVVVCTTLPDCYQTYLTPHRLL